MATFEAQVEGLTSLSIDGSSAPTQTELTQFLSDGAIEVINSMPVRLKMFCATEDTFTSTAVGSEAETLDSAQVLMVTRNDGTIEQPCRQIPASLRGRASDSADMNAATTTDPVYYIYNNKLNALPASGSCKYLEVNNPTVAYSDSAISNFPDEYEYLVPLYASVKSLQNVMGSMNTVSALDTTAIGAISTELNKADEIINTAKTKVDNYYTDIADIDDTTELWDNTNKRFQVVRDAMLNAQNLIDNNSPSSGTDAFDILGNAETAYNAIDANLVDAETVLGSDPTSGSNNIVIALTAMKTQAGSSVTALSNMAGEIGKAVGEVSGAVTEIGQAVTLADTSSSGIKDAIEAIQTAAQKFRDGVGDPSLLGDEDTYITGTGMANVKTYVERAISYINGDFPNANYDLVANLSDIDSDLTNEDIDLANARMQQARSTIDAVNADLKIADAYIKEWTTLCDTLIKEVNAFSSEVSSRFSWISAKAQNWNGKLAASRSYMDTANGYLSQANGFNSTVQAYANEVQSRIAFSSSYITASRARKEQGDSRINQLNATVAVAGQELARANVAISEINSIMASYKLDIEGVPSYLQSAQSYISQAQGYVAEANVRMAREEQRYKWYQSQQAKLQADYDKGIQVMR